MDITVARTIAQAAFRSSRELGALLPDLKQKLKPDEFEIYSKTIASMIAHIHIELVNELTAEHPSLEKEIESAIEKTGRFG